VLALMHEVAAMKSQEEELNGLVERLQVFHMGSLI
jgi:hypothetical protein